MQLLVLQCTGLMFVQLAAGYLFPTIAISFVPEMSLLAQSITHTLAHTLTWCVVGIEALTLFIGIFFGEYIFRTLFLEPLVIGFTEGFTQNFQTSPIKNKQIS